MTAIHRSGHRPAGVVETALELAFGNGLASILGHERALRPRRPAGDWRVVIRWGASRVAARELRQRGYASVRRFVVLPSRANPKWLFPSDNGRLSVEALRACTSYSRRVPRAIAMAAAALNWPCMTKNTVMVASRQPSYFETLAQRIAGERELGVTLTIGTPGAFRKLCAQWTGGDGNPVCLTKLPMTSEANTRVRHEARVLDALGRHGELRSRIPRLMQAGNAEGMEYLVQSKMEGTPGPVRYGTLHEDFLRVLHGYRPTRRSGDDVVADVAERFRRSARSLGRRWEILGADALGMASQQIGCGSIECALGHGDFTPWNTHEHDGQLLAFDWETAEMDVPCVWDRFHFLTQTRSLLYKGGCDELHFEMTKEDRAAYLLYLLDSAGKLAAEGSESRGVEYREAELLRQLRLASQLPLARPSIAIKATDEADFPAYGISNGAETIGQGTEASVHD